ncbi:MAG: sensor histidine kinase [Desulfitobacterium sp.]
MKNLSLTLTDTIKTIGILTAATLLSMGLRALEIGDPNVIMVYILSVLIISLVTRGYVYGVVASALCVLLFNFFFTYPYYTFHAIQRHYPITFAIMLVVAFLTSTLTIRAQNQLVESEKEKMRSNLLRAISHDLRTPLTGILGASSTLLEHVDSLDKQTQQQLLSNIKEDSQWLIRMVENLLSVTRIKEETMNVTKTPEAAEEIVAEAVHRIRIRFPEQKIRVRVPDELLMVPMDGILIEQVLINLLENAIKHSPENTDIEVTLKKQKSNAVFEVIDSGTGIVKQDFPYLFASYVPSGKRSADATRGMGIGLSICMSIIKAHHGTMEAANNETGGAVFQFTLPLEGKEIEQ